MRRLKFNVVIPHCVSYWEPGDSKREHSWPSAPARSLRRLIKRPLLRGRGNGIPGACIQPRLSSKGKKTAFGFPFSEAQLPHNIEHNQRLVRDRGIWTQVHLSQTSPKNNTFTILYQTKTSFVWTTSHFKFCGTFSPLCHLLNTAHRKLHFKQYQLSSSLTTFFATCRVPSFLKRLTQLWKWLKYHYFFSIGNH